MFRSHICQGNLRAYIFLSPEPFIQGTLNYVQRSTTTIITIMSRKKKWRSLANRKAGACKYKRTLKKKIQKREEGQKTYLFSRKRVENWKRMQKVAKSPLHHHRKAQKILGVTPEFSNEGWKFPRMSKDRLFWFFWFEDGESFEG